MLRIDFRYKKLASGDEKASRRLWLKKMNGRVKGLKLWRSRKKLNWKPFSIMFMLSRKVARKYVDFIKRMKMDEVCPAIIFSCQWGLPVLSHSSVKTGKNPVSCYKSLTWLQSGYHVQG